MIMDDYLKLSSTQAILNTGASTSHIDTLAAGDAISPGAKIRVKIATAYVDTDGGTIYATLQTDDENTFTNATTLITGPTITIAAGAAAAGGAVGVTLLDHVIPPKCLRYLRVYYTFSAAMDAGAMDAHIVLDTAKTMDKQL